MAAPGVPHKGGPFFVLPPSHSSQSPLTRRNPPYREHSDPWVSSTPHTMMRKFLRQGVHEKDRETTTKRKRVQRAVCSVWRSWRGFRLPTRQWACTLPLRSTSIPLAIPLTEASAHLPDNRPSREVNRWETSCQDQSLTPYGRSTVQVLGHPSASLCQFARRRSSLSS